MSGHKNWLVWGLYPVLFFLGIFLLLIRNPDPVINPVVFAEDGTWIALGLREGWVTAFFHSRSDYFVFLNTLLLCLSTIITTATNGGLIEHLPIVIAFVSYSFYSAFALLVYATINRVSSVFFGIFAFLMVLMVPLGTTQNEIIGRILQIGFYMPALAMMLFFWRDRCNRTLVRIVIDLGIFISAGTNPVVFVLAFRYFVNNHSLSIYIFLKTIRNDVFLFSLLSILALATLPRLSLHGGIPGGIDAGNIIEAFTARSILFPFIFPWYGKVTDLVSISLFFVFVLLVFFAVRASNNSEAKMLTSTVVATTAISTILTMIMRPGLTGLLDNYQTSFPDRYFMGLNVLALMLMVLVVIQFSNSSKTKIFGLIIAVSMTFVYVQGYSGIFEFYESRMPIRDDFSFKDQICLSEQNSGLSKIKIYPENPGWIMLVPAKYISKVNCNFHSYHELMSQY